MKPRFTKRVIMLLLTGAAMTAPLSAAQAQAQTGSSPSDETAAQDTIIVTGQRRLSRAPEDAKRQSQQILDSVGALEIQKLTDTTVAEALTRVPGVSFERAFQSQTAWYATIRGINGQYNSVDLDGGMFFDSTRNDREVYLDTVPASAINELVVYKTVTPDMDANSVGGHVSINTLRSFDLNGAAVTKGDFGINLYGRSGAPRGHGPGTIGNAVIKRTFGPDRSFGFVVAASYHDDDYSQLYNNIAYAQINGVDVPTGSVQNGNFDIHDHGYSVLAKLEARSADRFYAFVEATTFYADILQNNYRGGTTINTKLVTNPAEGTGNFTGGSAQAYSRYYDISRRLWTMNGGIEYKTSENSRLKLVTSAETSHHNETVASSAFYQFNGLSGTYNIGADGATLQLAPAAGLGDPTQWLLTRGASNTAAGSITHLPMTDHVYTARLDFDLNDFPFSTGLGFSTGINFRRLHRVFVQSADSYNLPNTTTYPVSDVLAENGRGSSFDGNGVVYINPTAFWNYVQSNATDVHTTTPSSSYDLTEDVYAGYAALHYNSLKIHAIAGARYEKTVLDDTTATINSSYFSALLSGAISSAGVPTTPLTFRRSYDYLLPNVQASYDLLPAMRVKAAYTETIARPVFTAFAQGLTINNFSNTFVFLRGSNPNLNARHSQNFDLSAETYSTKGFASIGIFHKNISGEYYYVTTTVVDPVTGTNAQLTVPQNSSSDKLTGVELAAEWRDFSALGPWLEGVTLRANATKLWGKATIVNTDGTTRTISFLNNQPDYLLNAMAIYDHGPITASLAYSRRGKTFLGVGSVVAADTYIQPYESLDARFALRPIRGIELFVAARNLLDGRYRETTGADQNQTLTAIRSGRSFTLGSQVRF